ncbi:hypothetical protein L0O81_16360, partial [Oliverpabstia sp. DFI.9.49]|nr:hypothetical protein [Oliverpabstia sp. DFI.9.49]
MGENYGKVIEELMRIGEMTRTHNSVDLLDIIYYGILRRSNYSYEGDIPNMEFKEIYQVRYDLYIDGDLDSVYEQ